jgi:hypothetical protein
MIFLLYLSIPIGIDPVETNEASSVSVGSGRVLANNSRTSSLFGWLVADGWCWFVLREKYCLLVADG